MKLEEKAALLSGKGEWQTWDFARLGNSVHVLLRRTARYP